MKLFRDNGGASLLKIYGTVYKTLLYVYPEIKWEKEWFINANKRIYPKRFWTMDNQRKFLDELGKQLGVNQPRRVTLQVLRDHKGASFLRMYRTLFNALQAVYGDVKWEKNVSYHPIGFWTSKENQRNFLDKLAGELGIKESRDWGRVTQQQVINHKGGSLLALYQFSLFNALQNVYNEIKWEREWFEYLPKYPDSYWDSTENQRNFLDSIASEYHIRQSRDWKRVSKTVIKNKGGQGLLSRYNNSLLDALKAVYPRDQWDELSAPQNLKKSVIMSESHQEVSKFLSK